MILADVKYLDKIEALGITHIDTGNDDDECNFLILDVSLTWNGARAQFTPRSVKDNSTLFKKNDLSN